MDDMIEKLLRRVLLFYAYPGNWAKPFGRYGRSPKATLDSGRLARAALKADSIGAILCTTCDVLNIAMTELSRKCGISDPRMAEIARGKDPTEEEGEKLITELDKIFNNKYPKHQKFSGF
jgi:hypothetical protein